MIKTTMTIKHVNNVLLPSPHLSAYMLTAKNRHL